MKPEALTMLELPSPCSAWQRTLYTMGCEALDGLTRCALELERHGLPSSDTWRMRAEIRELFQFEIAADMK